MIQLKKEKVLHLTFPIIREKLGLSFYFITQSTGIPFQTLHAWSIGAAPKRPSQLDLLCLFLNNEIKKSNKFSILEREKGISYYYLLFGVDEGHEQNEDIVSNLKRKLADIRTNRK